MLKKTELAVVCNEIEAETESGETQVELTKQIDIEAELSNMKIGGNDVQPDI